MKFDVDVGSNQNKVNTADVISTLKKYISIWVDPFSLSSNSLENIFLSQVFDICFCD